MPKSGLRWSAAAAEPTGPLGERSARLLPAVGAGVVVGVLLVIMATSYAALVFSGPLGIHLQKGIGLNLFGAVVGLMVVSLLSSMPWTIAGPQDITGAILGLAAASIATRMPPAANYTFLTVVLVMGVTSLSTGAVFLILGSFRLGDLIRYVPYPVIGGFLAGTGWLLVKGGVVIMTGTSLSWTTISAYGRGGMVTKWMLVTVLAALLVWGSRRYRHPLVVPAALAAIVALFYLVLLASGSSLGGAEAGGWLLGPFPRGDLWKPWTLEALGRADWGQLSHQAGTVASAVVVGVLALLLNATGIEMAVDGDLNLNRELRAAGAANVLIGVAGGMPGYHKLSATALAHSLGARTRMVAVVAAGVCAMALVVGASAVSLLPRLAIGGLVAYLGLNLLMEWVYDAWFRLGQTEYLLVLAILVVIAAVGFLPGVAAGTGVALVLFVVESSRTEVVTGEFTASTLPSNMDRAPAEQAVVSARSEAIHIMRLQGFLFFGTANRLLQRIRDRAEDPGLAPLEFLVLDFKRVSGIDSSAVLTFVKMSRVGRAERFCIVLTGVASVVDRRLRRGALGTDENVRILPDLDRGVQWCEDRILQEHDRQGCSLPAAMPELIGLTGPTSEYGPLSAYLEELRVPAGQVLIREGDFSDDLFVLQSGRLSSLMERPGGGTVRLRTMGPGTVVGEVGFYRGEQRTASVVADTPSVVYRLSKQALETMEERYPQAAADLHRMVAGLLAERLAMTLRSHRPFLD